MPCSSASRPWPETWSACVCVSSTPTSSHAACARLIQILLDRVGRIDDDGDAGVLVTDEVRGAPEVVVDELPEQHGADATNARGYIS